MPIDYAAEAGPKIAIRVQELFGLDRHPAIAGGKVPLAIELLSKWRWSLGPRFRGDERSKTRSIKFN